MTEGFTSVTCPREISCKLTKLACINRRLERYAQNSRGFTMRSNIEDVGVLAKQDEDLGHL